MLLTTTDTIGSIMQSLTLIFLFLIVLGITYVSTRYIAGYQKTRIKTGNMELIETLRISNSKYLQIVRTGKKYIVMAVCKDTVTLLGELDEGELVLDDKGEETPIDFKGLLTKAKQLYPQSKNQDADKRNRH